MTWLTVRVSMSKTTCSGLNGCHKDLKANNQREVLGPDPEFIENRQPPHCLIGQPVAIVK